MGIEIREGGMLSFGKLQAEDGGVDAKHKFQRFRPRTRAQVVGQLADEVEEHLLLGFPPALDSDIVGSDRVDETLQVCLGRAGIANEAQRSPGLCRAVADGNEALEVVAGVHREAKGIVVVLEADELDSGDAHVQLVGAA